MTDLEKMRQSIAQLRQEVERIKPSHIPEQILESTRDCICEFMRIIVEHAHLITGEKRMIMNQETIEKAARDYVMPNENIRPLMESIVAKEGFIAGADWRINSVWHEANEEPDPDGGYILVELQELGMEGTAFEAVMADEYGWFRRRKWKFTDLIRWAYVNDLLPCGDTEGGTE